MEEVIKEKSKMFSQGMTIYGQLLRWLPKIILTIVNFLQIVIQIFPKSERYIPGYPEIRNYL